MNYNRINFSKRIIVGINYLQQEASNNGADKIANILKKCVLDICDNIENEKERAGIASIACDPSAMAAISFLNKFASIRDEELRNEIVAEIERVQEVLN